MILKRKFYSRNTVWVAKDLLGCFLVREFRGKLLKAKIIETEAYRGEYDLACHASRGRTPRTETLYGEPGHAYVYMIYGMYYLLNAVAEKKDFPGGILIRAIEYGDKKIIGPGKLTKFLYIDKSLNKHDLTIGKKLWIERADRKEKFRIKRSPRVGIDYAKHYKSWKWNFSIPD